MSQRAQQDPRVAVLMVCLGNICRSPTAHGVLEKLIENNQLNGYIKVDSAGTGDWHIGEPPDARSIEAASRRGYSLHQQRARQVETADFVAFDYILAMDHSNLRDLRARCPASHQSKLQLLLDYGNQTEDAVPDPYYSGARGFELVLDLVEDACHSLLQHITRQHRLDDVRG